MLWEVLRGDHDLKLTTPLRGGGDGQQQQQQQPQELSLLVLVESVESSIHHNIWTVELRDETGASIRAWMEPKFIQTQQSQQEPSSSWVRPGVAWQLRQGVSMIVAVTPGTGSGSGGNGSTEARQERLERVLLISGRHIVRAWTPEQQRGGNEEEDSPRAQRQFLDWMERRKSISGGVASPAGGEEEEADGGDPPRRAEPDRGGRSRHDRGRRDSESGPKHWEGGDENNEQVGREVEMGPLVGECLDAWNQLRQPCPPATGAKPMGNRNLNVTNNDDRGPSRPPPDHLQMGGPPSKSHKTNPNSGRPWSPLQQDEHPTSRNNLMARPSKVIRRTNPYDGQVGGSGGALSQQERAMQQQLGPRSPTDYSHQGGNQSSQQRIGPSLQSGSRGMAWSEESHRSNHPSSARASSCDDQDSTLGGRRVAIIPRRATTESAQTADTDVAVEYTPRHGVDGSGSQEVALASPPSKRARKEFKGSSPQKTSAERGNLRSDHDRSTGSLTSTSATFWNMTDASVLLMLEEEPEEDDDERNAGIAGRRPSLSPMVRNHIAGEPVAVSENHNSENGHLSDNGCSVSENADERDARNVVSEPTSTSTLDNSLRRPSSGLFDASCWAGMDMSIFSDDDE